MSWTDDNNGRALFTGGLHNPALAESIARACSHFRLDDEDECVSEAEASCYDCRYRRWTPDSFECLKHST